MEQGTDAAKLDEAVTALEARYRRYLDEIADVKQRNSRVRQASTFFSQKRPFADDPVHAQARAEITALADQVTAAIDPAATGGAPLARAAGLILGEKRVDVPEYWPLVALEGLAQPWLASLDREDLVALAADYARANPRSGCLPNQRALRKEFKRLVGGAPRSVPTRQ
ncbi:MAG: hypothetical protein LBR32_11235 [Propionibacteriaceae bacterium]|jgi:hypothetical protein|nr:hypothetical protein [Propionibacteriaceae bacterium]